VVISGKQEPAVDGSIIVDVEIDVGDVGSAVVGCEDVTRMPAATADVECLVTSGTRTREALGGATLKIKRGAAVRPLRSRAAGAIPSETMWYSGEPSGKSVFLSLQLDMQLEKVKVAISHDLKRMIRRNKLLGMWAAEKLGFTGEDADAYSDALAVGTLDHERSDVFSRIRKDFDAAGVVESDEQILRVMDEFMLKAGNQMEVTRGDSSDSAVVSLARNLMR
jgi:hypothetical protein